MVEIVSVGQDRKFVDVERAGVGFELRSHSGSVTDHCCISKSERLLLVSPRAQFLESGLRGEQRLTYAAIAIDTRKGPRREDGARLRIAVGRQREHANRRLRSRVAFAWLIIPA